MRWWLSILLVAACQTPTEAMSDSDTGMVDPPEPDPCLRETLTQIGDTELTISVDWAPAAELLLVGTKPQLRLVEVGKELRTVATFDGHKDRVYVHWAPDGHHAISSSDDGTIKLLRIDPAVPSITELTSMALGSGSIYSSQWSPDGTHVLTGTQSGRMHLIEADLEAGDLFLVDIADEHVGKAYAVLWSPEGQRALSTGKDHTVRLWSVDTQAGRLSQRAVLDGPEQYVTAAWSPDGTRAVAGQWDDVDAIDLLEVGTDSLRVITTIDPHHSGTRALKWRGDLIATGDHDDRVHLLRFDADTDELTLLDTLVDDGIGVHELSWSPDGKRLARVSSKSDRTSIVELVTDGCP